MTRNSDELVIALAKGRILKDTLPLLAEVGIEPAEDLAVSRKLIVPTNQKNIKFLIVRATDAPTYVHYGAADLGIAGKDTLIEYGYESICELLDLQIAKCNLMVAVPNSIDDLTGKRLRVATKYVRSAREYFSEKGIHVDVIKLYGSMELAPMVGLSDCIVDLVDTGNTLKANDLKAIDLIRPISSRLIASRVSLKTKNAALKPIIDALQTVVQKRGG